MLCGGRMPNPDEAEGSESQTRTGRIVARPSPQSTDAFLNDGDHVVVATGEIDIYTAPKLWEVLARVIERGHREVVLDMAGVEFMDSQGISVIVRAVKMRSEDGGGPVTIRSARGQVRTVLEVTGLGTLVKIEN